MRKIYIFDTTLRDGEQSPGVNLNTREKLEIAYQLEKLGVDGSKRDFPQLRPGIWRPSTPWRVRSRNRR